MPLSLRMTRGRPYSSNSRSNSERTHSVVLQDSARALSKKRLNSSRTVNGSQRCPPVNHQPLKSTVQTSLGARATTRRLRRPAIQAFRCRRICTSPALVKIRWQLLALGAPPCNRKYSSRILRGPQLRWPCLSRTNSQTTASGTWDGLPRGRPRGGPPPPPPPPP